MRQKLGELQGEIEKSTIIVKTLISLLSVMNQSSRQKKKSIKISLKQTVPSSNWTDGHLWNISPNSSKIHIRLKLTRMFTKIEHILDIIYFNKFKGIEIIPSMHSAYNKIKWKISETKKAKKCLNTWRLNTTFLNNTLSKNKLQEKLKSHLNKNEYNLQNSWDAAKALLTWNL